GLTVIIPTKNRCVLVKDLLESFKRLRGLEKIRPEIIVADNDSTDDTRGVLNEISKHFPVSLKILKVTRPGKSAALNEAIRTASGEILAFLDDDVVLDEGWLEAVEKYFAGNGHLTAQGTIRITPPESDDPEFIALQQRYRTIPYFDDYLAELHSLNGANFAARREIFDRIGYFNERLGPGASGTSEDVELARRIVRAGIKIEYMKEAIVYHRVDRSRLTEAYFKSLHLRQGRSRLVMSNPATARILFNLCRAAAQYWLYSMIGSERKKYRSKGRIYHYLGMMEIKFHANSGR
ncbi:MAG: glycosyltransferase, partial [Alphaproteobacteria bacterium]